jgi:hypothetical protein
MRLQERKKKLFRRCSICGNDNYANLDCHRIEYGSKYTEWGTLIVCCNCHRKIHNNQIKIIGKYTSTCGTIICYKENGEEIWKKE